MRRHICSAIGCSTKVPPKIMMCSRHQKMVPAHLQKAVGTAYVPGHELTSRYVQSYLKVKAQAIAAVAAKEAAERLLEVGELGELGEYPDGYWRWPKIKYADT